MDSYTIKSIANGKVTIDFTINVDGKAYTVSDTFDARYIPLDTKENLDIYCANWISSWTPPVNVAVDTSAEVLALIGKKTEVTE